MGTIRGGRWTIALRKEEVRSLGTLYETLFHFLDWGRTGGSGGASKTQSLKNLHRLKVLDPDHVTNGIRKEDYKMDLSR